LAQVVLEELCQLELILQEYQVVIQFTEWFLQEVEAALQHHKVAVRAAAELEIMEESLIQEPQQEHILHKEEQQQRVVLEYVAVAVHRVQVDQVL
jgi:hypothetical protein